MCAYSWSRELMLVSPKYHAGSDGERRNVRKTEGSAVSYNCCFVFTRRRQAELSTVHYRLSCVAVPLACPSLCSLSRYHRSLRPAPAQWPPCEYRECPLPVILVSESLCIIEQVGAVAGRHATLQSTGCLFGLMAFRAARFQI